MLVSGAFLIVKFYLIALDSHNVYIVIEVRREQVPFSMAIENMELMHECSPKHLRMGTARLKEEKESEEEGKKRMNVERTTADTKIRSAVQSHFVASMKSRQSFRHDSPSQRFRSIECILDTIIIIDIREPHCTQVTIVLCVTIGGLTKAWPDSTQVSKCIVDITKSRGEILGRTILKKI